MHIIPDALCPAHPNPEPLQEHTDVQFPDGGSLSQDELPTHDIHYNHDGFHIKMHPILDRTPCDINGDDLEAGALLPLPDDLANDNFSPFANHAEFKLAELLYVEAEMSVGKINQLLNLLVLLYAAEPPFIFSVTYNGVCPPQNPPVWMDARYKVWFRSPLQVLEGQITNLEYKNMMDFTPKRVYHKGKHQYSDLMSGNWAWDQADEIAKEDTTHGAMFSPVILGSDKTTVSVATRQNDFYPLYASLGNVHNSVQQVHHEAVSLIAFLSIPKTSKEYANKTNFCKFCWQIFHTSLVHIFSELHPHMKTPCITLCCDGHLCHVIYGVGPYIADYLEQALLACIMQGWCPKCTAPHHDLEGELGGPRSHLLTEMLMSSGAFTLQELWDNYGIVGDVLVTNIYQVLTPDLLHQLIKGTFKDHIVTWVEQYIRAMHPLAQADKILADIDRQIAAVPPFPGLCHFHEGHRFKQWTGNDLKGLMKVYVPAIIGYVPSEMVKAVSTLIDLCYLVQHNVIDKTAVAQIQSMICPDGFSLPCQHSLRHYVFLIMEFGAPNGLCSLITKSKHIPAVKRTFCCSSRNKPLGQMLVSNQCINKIKAVCIAFNAHGMLKGPSSISNELGPQVMQHRQSAPAQHAGPENNTNSAIKDCKHHDSRPKDGPKANAEISLAKMYVQNLPHNMFQLVQKIDQPRLPQLVHCFLYGVLNPNSPTPIADLAPDDLPVIPKNFRVYVYGSACIVYYVPSNVLGLRGMHQERIRSTSHWYGEPSHCPCPSFFSFKYNDVCHPCALIHWFSTLGDNPDNETGMWVVQPDYLAHWEPFLAVIHLDTILQGTHLIGVPGADFLPSYPKIDSTMSLDLFKAFYVNKYADHHMHKIAF
ncbi:hypothetical protein V8E53_006632 [Lactarius tabidus]